MNLDKFKEVIHDDFARNAEFINKTIKQLNLDKTSKILDVGTGLGAMSIILALNGFNVLTGEPEVDPERDNYDQYLQGEGDKDDHDHHDFFESDWRESAKAVGVENQITYQFFDAQDLPFPDEKFDGIFLYDSLQHIQKKDVALMECIRVLNQDGVICVIEWNTKSIEEDYKKYGFKIDFIDPREILTRKDVSIDIIQGQYVNLYIIRKK